MNILQINGSAKTSGSHSTRLANDIVARLRTQNPDATLTLLDLATNPQPVLDGAALGALFTPPEARTPEQAARVALDDARIHEVQEADVIVIGVPMYNFGVPAQLKAWIDAICRARVTFRYTEHGVEGLLKGKRVYLAMARGGVHRGTPSDQQTPYLKTVLGFLGITDVHFVYAEGLNLGPEAEKAALQAAESEIDQLFAAA